MATGFYPDHVSVLWKIDGVDRTKGVGTDNSAVREANTNTYSITSRLRVSAKEWYTPYLKLTCIVHFYNGTTDLEFTADIYGIKGMPNVKYICTTITPIEKMM